LSFAGDGAITLTNTTGDATASNLGSTTAQYMVIRVTGALTTTKSITAPSYSKIYLVDNAATGGAVSFLRSGQATPVTIAAGESAFVYYNGTDYIKVTSDLILGGYTTTVTAIGTTTLTAASTLTQFFTGINIQTVVLPVAATLVLGTAFTLHNNSLGDLTVNSSGGNLVATVTPNTTFTFTCILTSGTDAASWDSDVTGFTSILPIVRGGTGTSSTTFANLTTNVTGLLPVANGGTGTATPALVQGTGVTITGSWPNQTINATGTGGTVTSVAVSGGTTGLTTSGGPITTSGTITLAGTLAIANGGTGETSRQNALDALAGSVTSGQYLRGNGTDVVMSAIQVADVPTLNQNTTGSAATFTSTSQNSQFNSIGIGTAASGTAGTATGTRTLMVTGSVSAPAYSFTGWTNSGIYNPDGNSVAITVNGTERFRVVNSGAFGVNGANYGNAGEVLTSAGSGAAPTWAVAGGGSQAFVAFGSTGGL
jgi:hypothetical protein